jgi:hypothetical protein
MNTSFLFCLDRLGPVSVYPHRISYQIPSSLKICVPNDNRPAIGGLKPGLKRPGRGLGGRLGPLWGPGATPMRFSIDTGFGKISEIFIEMLIF